MPASQPASILIIDDNPDVRNGLRTVLGILLDQVELHEAATAEEGMFQVDLMVPDLVILDLWLTLNNNEETNGLSVLKRIKSRYPAPPVYILTVDGSPESKKQSMLAGADDFYVKGSELNQLLMRVQHHFQTKTNNKKEN